MDSMVLFFGRIVAPLALVACATLSHAQEPAAPTRGQLLYDTHCIACHTSQVHWRDRRQATDFATLVAQVRQWQDAASLGWDDDDIERVARYLNRTIYRFAAPAGRAG